MFSLCCSLLRIVTCAHMRGILVGLLSTKHVSLSSAAAAFKLIRVVQTPAGTEAITVGLCDSVGVSAQFTNANEHLSPASFRGCSARLGLIS